MTIMTVTGPLNDARGNLEGVVDHRSPGPEPDREGWFYAARNGSAPLPARVRKKYGALTVDSWDGARCGYPLWHFVWYGPMTEVRPI